MDGGNGCPGCTPCTNQADSAELRTLAGIPRVNSARNLLTAAILGTLLTFLFWSQLWQGGGFIGGDTYTYFLPQKAFFADRLRAGEFPLWNTLAGQGYPLVAESQTAPLYPLNPLLYRWLDLNTAYVANHLLHYVLAFVAMWLLAVRLGLNLTGAGLAAIVYVYGWFPPRACLEWAIIGGVYLPLALWCAESWFQTERKGYALGLSATLALVLLAGHYHLAFITTVAVLLYLAGRWWHRREADAAGTPPEPTAAHGDEASPPQPAGPRRWLVSAGMLVCGYALAAPQLLPSWELKRDSQRTSANQEFDPGYGHLPPWYLCQAVTPWIWYARDADPDRALNSITGGSIPSATNKVEAHLYFGLLPLLLALWGLVRPWWTGQPLDPRLKVLAWIGLFGLVYATGWLLPLARHLPGFGFFRGPGRYGVLTTAAVALLSGSVLPPLWARPQRRGWSFSRGMLVTAVLCVTVADLWWVSRHQWYTFTTTQPIIRWREQSVVARLLRGGGDRGPARMLAPGPNLATLTGVAATPPYLGFGPEAYYLAGGRLPDPRLLQFLSGEQTPTGVDLPAQFEWLRQAGVTHILSMRPLPHDWPIELLWSGADPFLNPAWARGPHEPLYLYRLEGALGRVFLEPPAAGAAVRMDEYAANRVVVSVRTPTDATLVLTDLPWHDWRVEVDGRSVGGGGEEPERPAADSASADRNPAAPVQRRVRLSAGEHIVIWTYRPGALWWGGAIALLSGALLAAWVLLPHRGRSSMCAGWLANRA
jgi:hypothetical protein